MVPFSPVRCSDGNRGKAPTVVHPNRIWAHHFPLSMAGFLNVTTLASNSATLLETCNQKDSWRRGNNGLHSTPATCPNIFSYIMCLKPRNDTRCTSSISDRDGKHPTLNMLFTYRERKYSLGIKACGLYITHNLIDKQESIPASLIVLPIPLSDDFI